MLIVLHASLGYRSKYSNKQNRSAARTFGLKDRYMYWNSQKLYFRLQIGADICAFLTGEVISIGEVNKLVRLY